MKGPLIRRALAPHLSFVDLGGHGYTTVRVSGDPGPLERSSASDGGPLRYRVRHTARAWRAGERPVLGQQVIEGDPGLAI